MGNFIKKILQFLGNFVGFYLNFLNFSNILPKINLFFGVQLSPHVCLRGLSPAQLKLFVYAPIDSNGWIKEKLTGISGGRVLNEYGGI
uniref:Uncharacterized protein n=1 Tax=Meloidogyne enterolobii TaxID=390850 RepID=A0A6V7VIU0_MELEN|nr:unnamed protein product [Meloidogyne enterolobii]